MDQVAPVNQASIIYDIDYCLHLSLLKHSLLESPQNERRYLHEDARKCFDKDLMPARFDGPEEVMITFTFMFILQSLTLIFNEDRVGGGHGADGGVRSDVDAAHLFLDLFKY